MQKPRRLSRPPDIHPPRPAPRSCPRRPRLSGLPASPAGPGVDVEDPTWPDPGCEGGTRVTLPAPHSPAHRLELTPLHSPSQVSRAADPRGKVPPWRKPGPLRGALAHNLAEPQKEPQAGVPALSHPCPSEKSKSLQAQPRSPTPSLGGLPAPASPAGKRPGSSEPLVSTPNPTSPSLCRFQNSASPRRAGTHVGTLLHCGLPRPRPGPKAPVTMGSFQSP